MRHPLYEAIGIDGSDRKSIVAISKKTGIKKTLLDYYDQNCILPSKDDLIKLEEEFDLTAEELMLKMGILNTELKNHLAENSHKILKGFTKTSSSSKRLMPDMVFESNYGKLYKGDCMDLLANLEDNSIDLIFADPPFNLKKFYLSDINDDLGLKEYIEWTEQWLDECIRTLKPGGNLFVWNLPKWNTYFSEFLNNRLNFRHWIATDIKYSLPINGRLYPSHYSLLFYTKGDRPNTFHPDRLPMEICPKCYTDLKDYGGYKDKMNPKGINLTDIWTDIPPVRHKKYKRRQEANELSIKLIDRIIEMASNPDDVVFDPFGGSGTTYIVAEMKKRKWLGVELGPVDDIISRFKIIDEEYEYLTKYRQNYNQLFPTAIKEKRQQLNLWTDETFNGS